MDQQPSAKPSLFARIVKGTFMTLGGFFVMFVVVGIIAVNSEKDDKNAKTSQTGGQTDNHASLAQEEVSAAIEPPKPSIEISQQQAKFQETVASFYSPYRAAPNELRKSKIRAERRAALQKLMPNRGVKDWIGKLTTMRTTGKGNAYIEIELEEGMIVKTMNNEFSDSGLRTLINMESKLFSQIENLQEGDLIKFSGEFGSKEQDYLWETSMTELGSMTEPEFLFRFTAIKGI